MPIDTLLSKANYLSEDDLAVIQQAYVIASAAHEGQSRLSGEPYIEHPLAVACLLADLHLDRDTLAAALLHDTVEDTEISREDLVKLFGEDVARLVDGVTKLGKIHVQTQEEAQAENIRKMLVAMAQDIRVVLIKLADRLHNMRTFTASTKDFASLTSFCQSESNFSQLYLSSSFPDGIPVSLYLQWAATPYSAR